MICADACHHFKHDDPNANNLRTITDLIISSRLWLPRFQQPLPGLANVYWLGFVNCMQCSLPFACKCNIAFVHHCVQRLKSNCSQRQKVARENLTTASQKKTGAKATKGITIYWGIAAAQLGLGLFVLRPLLTSFYPVFAITQLFGLFDFGKAGLYQILTPRIEAGYVSENYVGAIVALLIGILILMALGAFAGINSKTKDHDGEQTMELVKSYGKLALISGVISAIIVLLAGLVK